MSKKAIKAIVGCGIALIAFGSGLILHKLGAFSDFNQALTHWLYTDETTTSQDIVVVAIDDQTLADPQQGGLGSLGLWPLSNYSQVVNQVEKGEPQSLFIDIFFPQANTVVRKSSLQALLMQNSNVSEFGKQVIEYLLDENPEDVSLSEALANYDNIYGYKKAGGDFELKDNQFHYSAEALPYPLIGDQMKLGFYNLNLNSDSANTSVIYGLPLQEIVAGKPGEHVDLMLAKDYLNRENLYDEVPIENGQMLIHYKQKPGDFETVSFLDVYNGDVDASVFKDKIVLLGVTSLGLHDFYYTPIAPETPMPGIEIHANSIQTLLDGDYLQYQDLGGFVLTLGLLLIFCIFAALYLPAVWGALVFVLELASYPLFAQWRFNHGTIVDLIWPVVALLASYLAVLAYRNFTEFAEKRKLKAAFSHYVAPEVVHQISEHPELLTLGGERRKITAFFLDIENFTHLSEGLQPQEVVKVINTYFDALSKEIMALGGTVDKFEGDAIMALFGAPVPSEDHAVKACLAALAIRAKMSELNAVSGLDLNVRIGLATGDAIVGNMGSEDRFDYTAMGDTVNTASRLEGANKFYKTRILVTEATAQAAGSAIFFREVDSVCLKGKDHVLHVYEVMGTLEGATEAGKTVMKQWQEALAAYRAGQWDNAERGMKAVMAALPDDGPASTLLTRIAVLKMQTPKSWDGVWRYEEK